MAMDFKKYEERFRKRSTASLIKGYSKFNVDFRKIARQEFKKRKVAVKRLPYKRRVVRRTRGIGWGWV